MGSLLRWHGKSDHQTQNSKLGWTSIGAKVFSSQAAAEGTTLTATQKPPEIFFNRDEFLPELRQVLEQPTLHPKRLVLLTIPIKKPETHPVVQPASIDWTLLALTDGQLVWDWETASLTTLFRGPKQPPVFGDYPEAYGDSFILLDLHVLEISQRK